MPPRDGTSLRTEITGLHSAVRRRQRQNALAVPSRPPMGDPTRIHWSHVSDAGDAGLPVGWPDAARWESLSFPRSWPDRPWIFGVMVASANRVVAWRRRGPGDDPVRAILGGDDRPERIADRRLMRYLRTIGDVGVGAQAVREQPRLVLTPQEPGDEPAP